MAAPSFVQVKQSGVSTGTTIAATFTGVPVAGRLLVAWIGGAQKTQTITPPAGWTVVSPPGSVDFVSTKIGLSRLYYKTSAGGADQTVTFTIAGPGTWTDTRLIIAEYNGPDQLVASSSFQNVTGADPGVPSISAPVGAPTLTLAVAVHTPDLASALSGYSERIEVLTGGGNLQVWGLYDQLDAVLPPVIPPPPPPPVIPPPPPPPATFVSGFGSLSVGGNGQSIVHVTNLNDSGTGSLRTALSGSNRTIVFDVAGTIPCDDYLNIDGRSNVTVDGGTAGGITLTGHGLWIRNTSHDIIVKNIRHRGGWDGGSNAQNALTMAIVTGSYNIIVDHCSFSQWWDEGITMWTGAHDVTVQWCIIGGYIGNSAHNVASLTGALAHRVTYHHNLFFNSYGRNPQAGYSDDNPGALPSDITMDVVNNFIWHYSYQGVQSQEDSWVNARGNYIKTGGADPTVALNYELGGRMWTGGGNLTDGVNDDASGSESAPFFVPAYAVVPATDALTAANAILAGAGCRPLDAEDTANLATVSV